ncbi:lipoprotein-releasing ABC transporter ATP-binding protein LolD [Motiliproteus sediminis]|uniref:lipoprotein-releasing ABC transporter ATP-binding protein LolD n=1 Tax=Motiliproteus sediminis TaxID=1468178 RepID=UPI001AF00D69|nr:lipoprotein-releasing ABC transporter ATP-binding protein LolD [Motiliproteus sediminis]
MSDQAVIECRDVCRHYQEAGARVEVLSGIDLCIAPGDRIAIVGSSGSGKSTLLNILSGLDDPSSGEVTVGGQALSRLNQNQRARLRNQHLGFVYQFHHLLPEFSALENVAMPLLLRQTPRDEVRQRAEQMLGRVGLSGRLQHKPAQLSGGERQRVAIARALVAEPGTVLMDEPTGNLDSHTAEDVQTLMAELNATLNTAFVVVTHDVELAGRMDRVLRLIDGRLVED